MIGEHDMVDVAGRIARHVAGGAIVAVSLPRSLRSAAIRTFVAIQAFGPEIRGLLGDGRNEMRIVAGTAPELFPARSLASAGSEIFSMARHFHLRSAARPHEGRKNVA
jgi:hypothetical protein